MRIAVLSNERAVDTEKILPKACEALRALGAQVLLPQGEGFPTSDCDSLIAQADIALAFGGDGTLIHIAKHAARLGRPVLGVNCGHLGFMTGMEANELSDLTALIHGDYTESSRMMLEITVNTSGKSQVFYALNEAVLSRGSLSRLIALSVFSDERPVVTYRADGVILATPTGSTAYSLSAGGPIIDPSVNCLLLTPICPHSLHTRSYIFGEDAVLTVKPESDGREMFLTIDGEEAIPISSGDTIAVRRSALAARIIQIKKTAFYEVLNQKLMDR